MLNLPAFYTFAVCYYSPWHKLWGSPRPVCGAFNLQWNMARVVCLPLLAVPMLSLLRARYQASCISQRSTSYLGFAPLLLIFHLTLNTRANRVQLKGGTTISTKLRLNKCRALSNVAWFIPWVLNSSCDGTIITLAPVIPPLRKDWWPGHYQAFMVHVAVSDSGYESWVNLCHLFLHSAVSPDSNSGFPTWASRVFEVDITDLAEQTELRWTCCQSSSCTRGDISNGSKNR